MSKTTVMEKYGIYTPDDIGEIRLSYENLSANSIKWYNYFFWTGTLLFCGYFWIDIALNFAVYDDSNISLIFFISFPVIYSLVLYLWIRRKRKKDFCVFVGSEGFYYYTVFRKNKAIKDKSVYRFKELQTLFYSKTNNYVNGSYTHTTYNFLFRNSSGKTIFNGKTLSMEILDKIENVWTNYLWEKYRPSLMQNKILTIKWDYNEVEIGFDYLKFNNVEFTSNDIKNYGIESGWLWIEHQNYSTKYLGIKKSGDRIKFSINDMPNKVFFFILLKHLVLHELND
jgi:hypothetical protein